MAAKQNILVTGGTGFVGKYVLEALLNAGHKCVATCRRTSIRPDLAGELVWLEVDLGQPDAAETLVGHGPWDTIVHMASAAPRNLEMTTAVAVNVLGTAQVLRAAQQVGAQRVVLVSTSDVYQPAHDVGTEVDEAAPLVEVGHPYPLSKRQAEDVARSLADGFSTLTILRPATVYGPGQHDETFLAELAESLRSGEQVQLAGEVGHRLTPTYVEDLAAIIVRAASHDLPGVFNVGGPSSMTETEVAVALSAHLHEPLAFVETPNRPISVAVTSRALQSAWSERPQTTFADGMKRTWD